MSSAPRSARAPPVLDRAFDRDPCTSLRPTAPQPARDGPSGRAAVDAGRADGPLPGTARPAPSPSGPPQPVPPDGWAARLGSPTESSDPDRRAAVGPRCRIRGRCTTVTANKNVKRLVRARRAGGRRDDTAALQQVGSSGPSVGLPAPRRRATAASSRTPPIPWRCGGPGTACGRRCGRAAASGARVVQLPEGATCFPGKRVLSSTGPDVVGPADWGRVAWDSVLDAELAETAALGRDGWASGSSTAPPTGSSAGRRAAQTASTWSGTTAACGRGTTSATSQHTKATWMYSPGHAPVVAEVDGRRLGPGAGPGDPLPRGLRRVRRAGRRRRAVLHPVTGTWTRRPCAVEAVRRTRSVHGFWCGLRRAPAAGPGAGVCPRRSVGHAGPPVTAAGATTSWSSTSTGRTPTSRWPAPWPGRGWAPGRIARGHRGPAPTTGLVQERAQRGARRRSEPFRGSAVVRRSAIRACGQSANPSRQCGSCGGRRGAQDPGGGVTAGVRGMP